MTPALSIEKATLADLDDILGIENLSFDSDRFSKRQFRYLIAGSKGGVYVLRLNRRIAGYFICLLRGNSGNLRLYSLAVHPVHRGKHLAQHLIDAAIGRAEEAHAKSISLEVKTTNAPALRLYEKNGFLKTGIRKGYYADGADAYLMRRNVEQDIRRPLR